MCSELAGCQSAYVANNFIPQSLVELGVKSWWFDIILSLVKDIATNIASMHPTNLFQKKNKKKIHPGSTNATYLLTPQVAKKVAGKSAKKPAGKKAAPPPPEDSDEEEDDDSEEEEEVPRDWGEGGCSS